MNTSEMYDFLKAVSSLFDGTLLPADADQLAHRLSEDVDAPALYLEFLSLDIDLECLCYPLPEWGSDPAAVAMRRRFTFSSEVPAKPRFPSRQSTQSSGENLAFELPLMKDEDRFEQTLHEATHHASSDLLKQTALRAAAEAARPRSPVLPLRAFMGGSLTRPVTYGVLLVMLVCSASIFMVGDRLWRSKSSATNSLPQTIVADLVASQDCEWLGADLSPGDHLSSKPLRLKSGVAQIQFTSGTQLVVEGPCDLELRSGNSMYLSHGKMLANVPSQAIGFTVETQATKVIDRGTEFAVAVTQDAETQLVVTQGIVDVEPNAGKAFRVNAGNAWSISRHGVNPPEIASLPLDAPGIRQLSQLDNLLAAGTKATVAFRAFPKNSAGNTGAFQGAIGLDFEVHRPIRVWSLGAFDALGDGFPRGTQVTVQLWSRGGLQNRGGQEVGEQSLAEATFTSDAPGSYEFGHRFKPLQKPLELAPGSYSIVLYGVSEQNNCVDLTAGKGTLMYVETIAGSIEVVSSRNEPNASAGVFPMKTVRAEGSYVAGSLKYEALDQQR